MMALSVSHASGSATKGGASPAQASATAAGASSAPSSSHSAAFGATAARRTASARRAPRRYAAETAAIGGGAGGAAFLLLSLLLLPPPRAGQTPRPEARCPQRRARQHDVVAARELEDEYRRGEARGRRKRASLRRRPSRRRARRRRPAGDDPPAADLDADRDLILGDGVGGAASAPPATDWYATPRTAPRNSDGAKVPPTRPLPTQSTSRSVSRRGGRG